MKRTALTHFIAFVLVACFLVCTAVSCKRDPDGGETTTEIPKDTTENIDASALPKDLDFKNAEVNVLYWDDVINREFEISGITGTLIDDAVYAKDIDVQEKLNVKLIYTGIPGNKKNLQSFLNYVRNNMYAGEKNVEIIATHSMTMGALAAAGVMSNLTSAKYIDFKKPWWPSDLIENSTINGKLYFASGDISLNTLLGMIGMFFNKDMARNNLYDYVRKGTWTIDQMLKETADTYIDQDGDGGQGTNDTYGYVTYSGMINPLFWAAGTRFADTSSDEIRVSQTYVSEKTQGLLEKVNSALFEGADWQYFPKIGDCTSVFVNNGSLFYMASVRLTVNSLADAKDLKYGILPNPKYDESQSQYHTLMANTYTMYGICDAVSNSDIHSAIIEALAEEGYRKVTPAVFEKALKLRYSDDGDDSNMFDILRGTVIMEIGLIFSDQIGGIPSKALFSCVNAQSSNWLSYMKSREKSMENSLEILNKSFD